MIPLPYHTRRVTDTRYTCVPLTTHHNTSITSQHINHITTHKQVTAASSKSQTTRREISGFFTEGNAQVQLIDTPGFIRGSAMSKREYATTCLS
jgi:ribosome-interacting GTPase 1